MVHKLIVKIIDELRSGLNGVMSDTSDHIVLGSINSAGNATDLPIIAVKEDALLIENELNDANSSEPRPQSLTQEVPLDEVQPQGPYTLAKTPLSKSALVKIVFEAGSTKERRQLLVEDKDFTIDYQTRELTFTLDVSEADQFILQYDFVGVFNELRFQQNFIIDIVDSEASDLEKWASLTSSIVFNNQNELKEHFNQTDQTTYLANQYSSFHRLLSIHFLRGQMHYDVNPWFRLEFQAKGELTVVKDIDGGFGLIEKVHSPGKDSDREVDIDINIS